MVLPLLLSSSLIVGKEAVEWLDDEMFISVSFVVVEGAKAKLE